MTFFLIALLWILAPLPLFAGELRGTVTEGGKSVGQGVSVEVRCGDKTYQATTDKYGSYRLFVPEKGKCTLTVDFQGQHPSREVISFNESTRYDFVLEKDGGGYALRRK
jgi:hypothetical protein